MPEHALRDTEARIAVLTWRGLSWPHHHIPEAEPPGGAMKRRVRRKAPWERRTRGRTPEEDAHEHSMELLALLRDSLDDMGRPLTPLEAAI
jgi:hypothetical protein